MARTFYGPIPPAGMEEGDLWVQTEFAAPEPEPEPEPGGWRVARMTHPPGADAV